MIADSVFPLSLRPLFLRPVPALSLYLNPSLPPSFLSHSFTLAHKHTVTPEVQMKSFLLPQFNLVQFTLGATIPESYFGAIVIQPDLKEEFLHALPTCNISSFNNAYVHINPQTPQLNNNLYFMTREFYI